MRILLLVIFIGLCARLYLATGSFNLDITNFLRDYEIYRSGGNLYKLQPAYNYSPLFYYVLIFLGKIHDIIPLLSLPFLIRAFLSCVDLCTLYFIFKLAQIYRISPLVTSALYFLNPVSIIISGHHGQFENISILFLVASLYIYEVNNGRVVHNAKTLLLTFLALSITIKHVLVFHPILFLRRISKTLIGSLFIYSLLVLTFLLSFVPFLPDAKSEIITQVFRYDALGGLYGVSHIYLAICRTCTIAGIQTHHIYKYLFIISLFIVSLKIRTTSLARDLLFLTLLFIVFTPGIGAQFFLLPIAFGSLCRSKWFYFYSTVVTLFYISNPDEIYVYPFQIATWNTVWLISICWLAFEIQDMFLKKKAYAKK